MALMTIQEIRNRMLHETPVQWCVYLDLIDMRLSETPFKTLRDFVTGKVSDGGLAIPIERAKEFLDFNPAYRHQAKQLKAKLGIAELAKSVEAVKEVGFNDRSGCDIPKNSTPTRGSTSAKYRIAKLKRDHPDVAKRLEAGEFKNVREAERAAGILPSLKPRSRLTLPLDDVKLARRLFAEWLECNYGVKK